MDLINSMAPIKKRGRFCEILFDLHIAACLMGLLICLELYFRLHKFKGHCVLMHEEMYLTWRILVLFKLRLFLFRNVMQRTCIAIKTKSCSGKSYTEYFYFVSIVLLLSLSYVKADLVCDWYALNLFENSNYIHIFNMPPPSYHS